jgi:sentrin-specific protease 1
VTPNGGKEIPLQALIITTNSSRPPFLDSQSGILAPPCPKWCSESIEMYGLLMNFVNRVQIKGVITPAFETMALRGTQPIRPSLQQEAGLLMMALGLHQKQTMGASLHHFSGSLNTWMPTLYYLHCGLYFSAFYQIFTCEKMMVMSDKVHSIRPRDEVDAICQQVINLYQDTEKDDLLRMKQNVLVFHISQQHVQPFPTALKNPTKEEEVLLQGYLHEEGNVDQPLRALKTYFPPVQTDSITRKDFQTLRPTAWLNDVIINCYLKMLCRQQRDDQGAITVDSYNHAHSTLFWKKLQEEGYRAVAKWGGTRCLPGRNIFSLNKLAIPINVGTMHWTCAMVCFNDRSIHHYDSTAREGRQKDIEKHKKLVKSIFAYLQEEYKENYDAPLPDQHLWKLSVSQHKDLPEQSNGYDCGVYCCSYVDFMFNKTPMPSSELSLAERRRHIAFTLLRAPEPTGDETPVALDVAISKQEAIKIDD